MTPNSKDVIAKIVAARLNTTVEQSVASQNLFADGLDSFGFIELILEVETHFQVKFAEDELLSPEMWTVSGIAKMVECKAGVPA